MGELQTPGGALLVTTQPLCWFRHVFCNSHPAPSQLIYFHAAQLAGGESGPVVTEQPRPLVRGVHGVQPLAGCQEGKSETLKEEGEGGAGGYFLERQSHSETARMAKQEGDESSVRIQTSHREDNRKLIQEQCEINRICKVNPADRWE